MDVLLVLDDGLWIEVLELGLQCGMPGSHGHGVGAAAGFGRVVGVVLKLRDTLTAPLQDG